MGRKAPDLYLYAYRADYYQVSQQGVQFGVSFPLLDWGELGGEHSQKKMMAKSLKAEAEASRRTLKAELLKALELCKGQMSYVSLLEQQFQDREALAYHSLIAYDLGLSTLLEAITGFPRQNHQLALQLEEIARRRFSAGQISQDEWRQARLLSTSALASLQQHGAQALAAEEHFRALVGYPEDKALSLPGCYRP
jgi:outer membrane protein TolC